MEKPKGAGVDFIQRVSRGVPLVDGKGMMVWGGKGCGQ